MLGRPGKTAGNCLKMELIVVLTAYDKADLHRLLVRAETFRRRRRGTHEEQRLGSWRFLREKEFPGGGCWPSGNPEILIIVWKG